MSYVSSLDARERRAYAWILLCGAALLLIALCVWWRSTSVNPERVFWGAITNSFSARGVTLTSSQQSAGTTNQQILHLDLGPEPKAHSVTTLTRDKAVVKTENLSTPTKDYTRYAEIKNGKNAVPKNVIGVWADTTDPNQPQQTLPPLFGQVLLGRSLPFGNFTEEQRRGLIEELRTTNLYATSYAKAEKRHKDGRLQYVYTVNMQPILYIRFMKDYAKQMGLHDLDKVDPNSYSGVKAVSVKWTVDARSRQLVGVDYGNGHQETYAGFGLPVQTPTPAHAISGAELQKRLSVK